ESDLLESLVPFEDAFTNIGAILVGHGFLDPVNELAFGRYKLGGILRVHWLRGLDAPALHVTDERGLTIVLAEGFDGREKIADGVIGDARLIAAVGQLHHAVVDKHGIAPAVDRAAAEVSEPAAAKCRFDLQFVVMREGFDFMPTAAAGIERAEGQ